MKKLIVLILILTACGLQDKNDSIKIDSFSIEGSWWVLSKDCQRELFFSKDRFFTEYWFCSDL